MKKDCLPIASCNPTYLGLDLFGWTANILAFAFVVGIFGFGKYLWGVLGVQIFLNYIYVKIILRMEENIVAVIMSNQRIPSIIWGYSNRFPAASEKESVNVDIKTVS